MVELNQCRDSLLHRDECWALVERIASSPQLKRASRLKTLFLYICRCAVLDGAEEIHEQEIGCAVFGRPETYDTNIDNIVRTSMSDLRKRLEAYFDSEAGQSEQMLVQIPRGRYVPAFTHVDLPSAPLLPKPVPSNSRRTQLRFLWAAIAFSLFMLGVLTGWRFEHMAMQTAVHPWRSSPAVADLWSRFLDARQGTDIIMADTSFLLVQTIDKQAFTFNDYLNRSYIGTVLDQQMSPDMHAALSTIASKNLGSSSDFRLTERLLALDPSNKTLHVYNAREYMPALAKQNNVVLLGSKIANPWDDLFDAKLNFKLNSDRIDYTVINNRAPLAGEQSLYVPTDNVGYCVVAFLPNPDSRTNVLMIEGTSSEAVEAAGDFLLSEDRLAAFRSKLNVERFPYFEVLLRTSQVRSTPLAIQILSYRTYSDPLPR